MKPHLELAKSLWRSHLQPGDLVIDATLGNGHDSLFLAELGCEVISLDIQLEALESAQKRLAHTSVKLFHQSHENLSSLPLSRSVKLIVYNLGYLPGGNKTITTQQNSTLASVSEALQLLAPNGALSITCYPGHNEGLQEEICLLRWASSLDPALWRISHHRWPRPRAPSLLWIQKPTESLFINP